MKGHIATSFFLVYLYRLFDWKEKGREEIGNTIRVVEVASLSTFIN